MFNLDKYPWIVPVLLVALGAGWLLNTLEILPGVNWAYILCVGALGVVILLQGINKLSFVVGLFLVIGSVAAYLRQGGYLSLNVELPGMVIVLGALMLIAHAARLPNAVDATADTNKAEEPKKHRLAGGTPRGPADL